MKLTDLAIGDMVVLPSGEHGRVSRLDHDDNTVWVDVAVADGIDTVDLDPSEVTPCD